MPEPDKRIILYIGNRLSKHGSTPTSIEVLGPQLEREGHTVYYASEKSNAIRRMADMMSSIVRYAGKIDLVLIDTYSTSAFYFAWISARLCRLLKIPYIPILHGGDLPHRFKVSPELSDAVFKNSFTNVVVSGYLQKSAGERGYKNVLIPNNIHINAYPYLQRTTVSPKLLWVRAFHKTYNPSLAIDLVALLRNEYPDVSLTMVGPEKDGSMATCQRMVKEKGLSGHIKFTGRLGKEEWIALAAHHDIFINTTNFDNLPVSVMEAMALGLPVVSTDVGGVPYLIDKDESGLLVPPRQPEEMADAIRRLLATSGLAEKISRNARRKAEAFDWQYIRHQWNALFKQVHH